MKLPITVGIVLIFLSVTGCRTIQDFRYIEAANAAEEGRDIEAFQKYFTVAQAEGYSGQASAQFIVADMYMEGKGTARNPREGLRYFELVANNSDRTWRRLALMRLGLLNESGIPGALDQDRVKAANYYKLAEAEGDKTARNSLDRLSAYPYVYVDQNPDEFKPQGSVIAPAGLSAALRTFTSGDKATAVQTFLWHARRGNEEAQTLVAKLYKEGTVLPKDLRRYAAWAWLAARSGNPRAQFEMGLLNSSAEVFKGSDREAEYWFQLASSQGVVEATNWLGIIAAHPVDGGKNGDWGKAVKYFSSAAEGGSTHALVNLGDAYMKGLGVPVDTAKAVEFYKQAAASGNVEARYKLHENGIETPKTQPKSADVRKETSSVSPTQQTPRSADTAPRSSTAIVGAAASTKKLGPVEIYSDLSPSVFRLLALQTQSGRDVSQGSAVAVGPRIAITNCHVVDGRYTLGAKISDEVTLFKLIHRSTKKDICIVQGDRTLREVKQVRRYSDLKVGEKVYAIGSPQSLDNTLSEGIVSGLREMDGVRYIQTTAPIAQGSSGGGLFDEDGKLIGITTFIVKGGGNLNFAVAIDEVLEELDALK